jgi:hypothetical protein
MLISILSISTFPIMLPANADLVWADVGNDLILTANDNGAGVRVLVNLDLSLGNANHNPVSITSSGGRLYWADDVTRKIHSSGMDGSAPNTVINLLTEIGSSAFPTAIASDGQFLYFTAQGGRLWRCGFNGSNLTQLFTYTSVLGLDAAGVLDALIWGDSYYFADSSTDTICRVKLDGTGGAVLVRMDDFFGDTDWLMRGISTDGQNLYWGAAGSGVSTGVFRCRLDGASPTLIVSENASVNGVTTDGQMLFYTRFGRTDIKSAPTNGPTGSLLVDLAPINLGNLPWDMVYVPKTAIPIVEIGTTSRVKFQTEVGKLYSIRAAGAPGQGFLEIATLVGNGLVMSYADNRDLPGEQFYQVVITTP